MLEQIIDRSAERLEDCFEEPQVEQMARDCGFVQRKSKLTGLVFLKTLVFGFIQYPRATLKQLCQACLDFGVNIKPQGLDQRINEKTVVFMQQMLTRALSIVRARRRKVAEVLDQFTAIYFLDSTTISLPDALRGIFQGVGGNASSAAVKIQLLFEFLTGNIAHPTFVSARKTDQAYQEHVPCTATNLCADKDGGVSNSGATVLRVSLEPEASEPLDLVVKILSPDAVNLFKCDRRFDSRLAEIAWAAWWGRQNVPYVARIYDTRANAQTREFWIVQECLPQVGGLQGGDDPAKRFAASTPRLYQLFETVARLHAHSRQRMTELLALFSGPDIRPGYRCTPTQLLEALNHLFADTAFLNTLMETAATSV